ncbi:TPA: RNA-dependent RNA polymerase [Tapajos virus]|uniref:Replicase n=1 Tax=Tapajos virus TaxID=2840185 RepID=A0AAD3AW71_9MONO|nr:RNA-dependent RNA polymerase [Tapajos virus]FAA04063.1 TPA: RNA-dependent RNA polymerase [Tapajos virus]
MDPSEAQFPDGRLNSPIVLDAVDLFSRHLSLQSCYSKNPRLSLCEIPSHIKRQAALLYNNDLLSYTYPLTLPCTNLLPTIIEEFKYDESLQGDNTVKAWLYEATQYASEEVHYDHRWIQEHVNEYSTQLQDTNPDNDPTTADGITEPSLHNTDVNMVPDIQRISTAFSVALHCVTGARKCAKNRSNTRCTFKHNTPTLSLCCTGDFVVFRFKFTGYTIQSPCFQAGWFSWYPSLEPTEMIDLSKWKYFCTIVSYDWLLMLKDIIMVRYNALVLSFLGERQDNLTDYPSIEAIINLFEQGDKLLEVFGNAGYTLLKYFEPLILGRIQACGEESARRMNFLYQMIYAYQAVEDPSFITCISKSKQLTSLLGERKNNFLSCLLTQPLRPQQLSELFSLQKAWGHPFISSHDAISKVRVHGTTRKALHVKTVQKVFCVFKYQVAKEYFRVNKRWYMLLNSPTLTPHICSFARRNIFPTLSQMYPFLEEWYHVEHSAIYNTRALQDLSVFIKDRATATGWNEWDSVFSPAVLGYQPPRRSYSKRVPEQFLDQSDFSLQSVISYGENLEYLTEQQVNFSYSLKEKELSVGRLFGKLPYKTRNVQTLCEALLADGIAKAFPNNMMVVTEREQKQTLLSQARLHHCTAVEGEQVEVRGANFVADLEKYNLAFRWEFTKHFIEYCNMCYGTVNVFEWMSFLIPSCYMHVSSYYDPPYSLCLQNRLRPNSCENAYRYHCGGIEGLQQKMWTSISCAQILLVEVESGLKVKSALQGDNQCITSLTIFPKGTSAREQTTVSENNAMAIAAHLCRITAACGIFLKPEETFVHSGFIYFGKKIYLQGIVLPQSLKTLVRMGPLAQSIYDDAQGALASIGTCAEKAYSETRHILPVRWIAHTHTWLSLRMTDAFHLGCSSLGTLTEQAIGTPLTNETLRLLTLVPNTLGGLNFLLLEKVFYRNLPDPVTSSLYQLQWRLAAIGKIELYPCFASPKRGHAGALDLVLNPLGLNIPGSQEISMFLRRRVRSAITLRARNKLIRTLFNPCSMSEDDDLAEWLLSSTPVMPRFAADLYERTPSGKRLKILGYLEGTKTIVASSLFRSDDDEESIVAELNRLIISRWKTWLMCGCQYEEFLLDVVQKIKCTEELAQFLRLYTWSHVVGDRGMVGSTAPCLLEQFKVYNNPANGSCIGCVNEHLSNISGHATARLSSRVSAGLPSRQRLCWTIGSYFPYLGSTTGEKIGDALFIPAMPSAPLRDAIEIYSRAGWVTQSGCGASKLVANLISSRVSLDPELIKLLSPRHHSQNILHRYHDHYSQRSFMANRISNAATRVLVSTNQMGKFSSSSEAATDSNIIFQNVINFAVAVIDIRNRFKDLYLSIENGVHIHLTGCCTRVLEAGKLFFQNPAPKMKINYELNELVYDEDPLKTGFTRSPFGANNKHFTSQDFSDMSGEVQKFALTAPLGFCYDLTEIIIQRMINQDQDGETPEGQNYITEFLAYDFDFILYCLGYALLVGLWRVHTLRPPSTEIHIITYIGSLLSAAPYSAYSVLFVTLRHPSVYERICTMLPSISHLYGGTSTTRALADLTKKLYTEGLTRFLQVLTLCLKNPITTNPLIILFPAVGQTLSTWSSIMSILLPTITTMNSAKLPENITRLLFIERIPYAVWPTSLIDFRYSALDCIREPVSVSQGHESESSNSDHHLIKRLFRQMSSPISMQKKLADPNIDNEGRETGNTILKENDLIRSHTPVKRGIERASRNGQPEEELSKPTTPSLKKGTLILKIKELDQLHPAPPVADSHSVKNLLHTVAEIPDMTHFVRMTGIVSSMHYKLDEVLDPWDHYEIAVCLAEGEGAGLRYLIRQYGINRFFFNTLAHDHQIINEVAGVALIPRMLRGVYPRNDDLLRNGVFNNRTDHVTDIGSDYWLTQWSEHLPNQYDIITMDAESVDNSERIPLYRTAITLFTHKKAAQRCTLVVKGYLADVKGLNFLLGSLFPISTSLYLIKPISSNFGNTEWYIKAVRTHTQSSYLWNIRTRFTFGLDETLRYCKAALMMQTSEARYQRDHLVKLFNTGLHERYLTMGFKTISDGFRLRYSIERIAPNIREDIVLTTLSIKSQILKMMREDQRNKTTRFQSTHFTKGFRGQISHLVAVYCKYLLLLQGGENGFYPPIEQIWPIWVCEHGVFRRSPHCRNHLLVSKDFLIVNSLAERKVLNRMSAWLYLTRKSMYTSMM